MTKHKYKKLRRLIRQWTRAEVIARLVPFKWIDFGEAYRIKLQKEDEIRKLLFGTSNLVELGDRWNLPIRRSKVKKHPGEKER